MLSHHMTIDCFRLLRKNLGNLWKFLGKRFMAPPSKKLPVRLCSYKSPGGGAYYDCIDRKVTISSVQDTFMWKQ